MKHSKFIFRVISQTFGIVVSAGRALDMVYILRYRYDFLRIENNQHNINLKTSQTAAYIHMPFICTSLVVYGTHFVPEWRGRGS